MAMMVGVVLDVARRSMRLPRSFRADLMAGRSMLGPLGASSWKCGRADRPSSALRSRKSKRWCWRRIYLGWVSSTIPLRGFVGYY